MPRARILYAHRGAKLELPENTIPAFSLALELGATAIETDVHMTRDGRVVVSHDPRGARMAGVDRAIAEVTHAETQTWDMGARFTGPGGEKPGRVFRMPTFDEVLATFPSVRFNVDAKQVQPDMIPALVRIVRAAKAEDRVRIASFSSKNLARARALGYEGSTGTSFRELLRAMYLPSFIARRTGIEGDAAQVPRRSGGVTFASQSSIARLHALGLRVDFWTIDDPVEARALLTLGADGIMTDDIRAVAPVFRDAR